ncbi:MAG: hypothetical protein FWE49_03185 [Synergistaceae bacterium]|nr:hypothetical protein [Synergistaceae bacterium]
MAGITSSMSPGYLQINPRFSENVSMLNKKHKYSNEKPVNDPNRDSKDSAVKDAVSRVKSAVKDGVKERAVISELEKNERQVLAHEAAHVAVGGRFVGTPKYTRVLGPDGKSYVTGGEVPISVLPSSDPKEAIRNLEQVRAAALAPIDPSAQDIGVAAAAANAIAQEAAKLATHQAEWGMAPQPVRYDFEATDRIPAALPIVKNYDSSVDGEESSGVLSYINLLRKGILSETKTSSGPVNLTELKPFSYSQLSPDDNLYNTRQAVKVYYMSSSPKGLWTIGNGFEMTSSSPALRQAQIFNIAA